MALPDTIKLVPGTALVFANTGEYSPSDAGQPTGVDADIDLQNVGASGVCRQSVKLDLGANLDLLFVMRAYIEFFSSPTAGGAVNFYLGFSVDPTAGEDNPGNLAGTDSVYQGYGADTASGTEALPQLDFIGSLIVAADTDIQSGEIGVFRPKKRYCCLVVENRTDTALAVTDAIETAVVITPLQHQIQD